MASATRRPRSSEAETAGRGSLITNPGIHDRVEDVRNQIREHHHHRKAEAKSLRVGVITVSDTRTVETDTGGALVLHRSLTSLQHQGHHITWLGLRAEFAELLKLVASETPRPKGGASLKPKKTVAFVCPGLPFIPMQSKGLSWQV